MVLQTAVEPPVQAAEARAVATTPRAAASTPRAAATPPAASEAPPDPSEASDPSDVVTLERSDFRQLVVALRNLRERRLEDQQALFQAQSALQTVCRLALQGDHEALVAYAHNVVGHGSPAKPPAASRID